MTVDSVSKFHLLVFFFSLILLLLLQRISYRFFLLPAGAATTCLSSFNRVRAIFDFVSQSNYDEMGFPQFVKVGMPR